MIRVGKFLLKLGSQDRKDYNEIERGITPCIPSKSNRMTDQGPAIERRPPVIGIRHEARAMICPVKSDNPAEYRRLVEGAWVIRRGGYYSLFASGDNCCGARAHYGVFVARSRSAIGPFKSRPRPAYLVVEGDKNGPRPAIIR